MMRPLAGLAVIAVLSGGCGRGSGQPGTGITAQASDAAATAEVRAVLDNYLQAVKSADENLLREVSAQPENVSYVNPMQRLRSWGLDAYDFTLGSREARAVLPSQPVHVARELFAELVEQVLTQELLLERLENSRLHHVTPDGQAITASGFLASAEACRADCGRP
jgi:hypothetical protein